MTTEKLQNCHTQFQNFFHILKPITQLEVGDKLCWTYDASCEEQSDLQKLIYSKVEIQKPSLRTSISRWYYGESRQKTLENCMILFQHYNKLMDDIIYGVHHGSIRLDFYQLGELIQHMNNNLIEGLHKLKQTYEDYDDLKDQIEAFECNISHFDGFMSDILVDTLHTDNVSSSKPSDFLSDSCLKPKKQRKRKHSSKK